MSVAETTPRDHDRREPISPKLDFSPRTWFPYDTISINGGTVEVINVNGAKDVARKVFEEQGVYTEQVEAALTLADKAHQDKVRKVSGEPYLVHPLITAIAVAHVTDDGAVVSAALDHDVVEDSPSDHYGNKIYTLNLVADIIASGDRSDKSVQLIDALTSDVTYNKESVEPGSKEELRLWQNQKAAAVNKAIKHSPDAVLIKCADFLSNITDFVNDYNQIGEDAFLPFKRKSIDFVERFTNGIVQMNLGLKKHSWGLDQVMKCVIIKQLEFIELCRDERVSHLFDGWSEEMRDILADQK